MQKLDVEKREVEELLGAEISEELFHEALEYAKRKQAYIFSRDNRPVVMRHWYLVKLTEECVRSLVFSGFTMALYEELSNMNMKREPGISHSSPTLNHIVTVSGI